MLVHLGSEALYLFKDLPGEGVLFPHLSKRDKRDIPQPINQSVKVMRRPKAKLKPVRLKTSAPVKGRSWFPAWLLAVLLGLVTLALYWPAMSHDFINYDDNVYVTANIHVHGGLNWENIKWAFINSVGSNWHPLTVLSHMLDCQMYGLNPWGHHLTNVLLHALNAALVFALFKQLTGAMWRSLLVAGLFAVHPLRVESVAWVAERKDVLSACFWLLSLLFYARYAQKRTRVENRTPGAGETPRVPDSRLPTLDYALSLFFFTLGLMSKAMLVTSPFVMLLLDYWPLGRVSGVAGQVSSSGRTKSSLAIWRLVREKIPFFALAVATGVVNFMVQKQAGAVAVIEQFPLGARIGNALISYCRYLWEAVLAGETGGVLSAPRLLAARGGAVGGRVVGGNNGAGFYAAPAISIFADGLVVVCGDAGAGDWVGAGGRTGDGGSVCLYSVAGGGDYCHLGSV